MASTPSGSYFAFVDRALAGQLAARLRGWRTEDPRVTFDDIAGRLRAEGFALSRETVLRWCKDLDLIEPSTGDEAA
jgi:hypothetical protein